MKNLKSLMYCISIIGGMQAEAITAVEGTPEESKSQTDNDDEIRMLNAKIKELDGQVSDIIYRVEKEEQISNTQERGIKEQRQNDEEQNKKLAALQMALAKIEPQNGVPKIDMGRVVDGVVKVAGGVVDLANSKLKSKNNSSASVPGTTGGDTATQVQVQQEQKEAAIQLAQEQISSDTETQQAIQKNEEFGDPSEIMYIIQIIQNGGSMDHIRKEYPGKDSAFYRAIEKLWPIAKEGGTLEDVQKGIAPDQNKSPDGQNKVQLDNVASQSELLIDNSKGDLGTPKIELQQQMSIEKKQSEPEDTAAGVQEAAQDVETAVETVQQPIATGVSETADTTQSNVESHIINTVGAQEVQQIDTTAPKPEVETGNKKKGILGFGKNLLGQAVSGLKAEAGKTAEHLIGDGKAAITSGIQNTIGSVVNKIPGMGTILERDTVVAGVQEAAQDVETAVEAVQQPIISPGVVNDDNSNSRVMSSEQIQATSMAQNGVQTLNPAAEVNPNQLQKNQIQPQDQVLPVSTGGITPGQIQPSATYPVQVQQQNQAGSTSSQASAKDQMNHIKESVDLGNNAVTYVVIKNGVLKSVMMEGKQYEF